MKPLSNRNIYKLMIRRCENPNDPQYKSYGGRGISVCDRWKQGISYFNQDMDFRATLEMSLDRSDNDGNYCPENCRRASRKVQNRNTSRVLKYVYDGREVTLIDLYDEKKPKMGYRHFRRLVSEEGVSIETALSVVSKKFARSTRAQGFAA